MSKCHCCLVSAQYFAARVCMKRQKKKRDEIALLFVSVYRYARPTGKQYEGVTILQRNLFCNML